MSHVAALFVEKTCFTIKLPFICSFAFWMIQHKNVNKVYTCHFKYFCLILTTRFPVETYQALLERNILISMKHISV